MVLRVGDGIDAAAASDQATRNPVATVAYAALLVKQGGEAGECEDRAVWRYDAATSAFRAAIADGASASLMAGEWAELLATEYCKANDNSDFDGATVFRLADRWRQRVAAEPLPWYAQAKAALGAFATLAGVTVHAGGRWDALTAGDSCVFQVRDGALVAAHPIDRANDFGRVPILLGTAGVDPAGSLQGRAGSYEPGDHLYLMTDALAAWALGEIEGGRDPWNWLAALETDVNPLPFARWIADRRGAGRLENDDVCLLHLRLGGDPE